MIPSSLLWRWKNRYHPRSGMGMGMGMGSTVKETFNGKGMSLTSFAMTH